jgi:hypothetical protein
VDPQGYADTSTVISRKRDASVAQANSVLSAIEPRSGPVGTVVTIIGTGFAARDNKIFFGTGRGVASVSSRRNGSTLQFSVPRRFTTCPGAACLTLSLPVAAGTYPVFVVNSAGRSNALTFVVTP